MFAGLALRLGWCGWLLAVRYENETALEFVKA
jgi:hypothetical protein